MILKISKILSFLSTILLAACSNTSHEPYCVTYNVKFHSKYSGISISYQDTSGTTTVITHAKNWSHSVCLPTQSVASLTVIPTYADNNGRMVEPEIVSMYGTISYTEKEVKESSKNIIMLNLISPHYFDSLPWWKFR